MAETVEIKWSNFQPYTLEALNCFKSESYLTDVTLISEDRKSFPAHKLILTTASEYFEQLFRQNTSFHQTFICLEKVSNSELTDLINFIYLGQVSIPNVKINRFLELANRFSLKGLSQQQNDFPEEVKEELIDKDGTETGIYIEDTNVIDEDSFNSIEGKILNKNTMVKEYEKQDKLDTIEGKEGLPKNIKQKKSKKFVKNTKRYPLEHLKDKKLSANVTLFEESTESKFRSKMPKIVEYNSSNDSLHYSNNKNLLIYLDNQLVTIEKVDEALSHLYTKTGQFSYTCHHCSLEAKNASHMKEHAERHLENLRYICSDCGISFKKRYRNRSHIYLGQCLRVQSGREAFLNKGKSL